ncbi:MAG TPA: glycosyltransferase family 2 protein [Vicinamibacteria bacterium]|nr:glycosyltransferase family 2 protein [Vicinamibacteria bacterium]
MRTLTVVCPVYNEEAVVEAFYSELSRVLRAEAERWRPTMLFVVDRSSDRTLDELRRIAAADPCVRVLALSNRFGQQAALLAGLDHSDSDAVVMMDADLQHPPAVIPELLAAHEQGADVVYTLREDTPDVPWFKRRSARLFYRLLDRISETPVHEGAADFRLVSRRVARVFQDELHERSLFLRGLFNWVGFRSAAVRFRLAPRAAGRTKYSLRRMLNLAVDGVVSFSRVPLRLSLLAGALAMAFDLLVAAGLAGRWLLQGVDPGAPALLALLVVFLCGVQLVFLGVVGEYLGRVLDEVKHRPRYLVDEKINFPS